MCVAISDTFSVHCERQTLSNRVSFQIRDEPFISATFTACNWRSPPNLELLPQRSSSNRISRYRIARYLRRCSRELNVSTLRLYSFRPRAQFGEPLAVAYTTKTREDCNLLPLIKDATKHPDIHLRVTLDILDRSLFAMPSASPWTTAFRLRQFLFAT